MNGRTAFEPRSEGFILMHLNINKYRLNSISPHSPPLNIKNPTVLIPHYILSQHHSAPHCASLTHVDPITHPITDPLTDHYYLPYFSSIKRTGALPLLLLDERRRSRSIGALSTPISSVLSSILWCDSSGSAVLCCISGTCITC